MKLNKETPIETWREVKAVADNPAPSTRTGGSFILTPAYGRVYTSKAAVLRDYNDGKDFISQPDGRYCNIEDIKRALAVYVQVRYGKGLRKVMVI